MLRQPLLFAYWLPKHLVHLFIPPLPPPSHTDTFSYITYGYLPLTVLPTQPLHSQLGHIWLPNPHCASHPTFAQSVRPPLVTYPSLCFPPNPYLVKQTFP